LWIQRRPSNGFSGEPCWGHCTILGNLVPHNKQSSSGITKETAALIITAQTDFQWELDCEGCTLSQVLFWIFIVTMTRHSKCERVSKELKYLWILLTNDNKLDCELDRLTDAA